MEMKKIKYYNGEKENPFVVGEDGDKPFLWDFERAFIIADKDDDFAMKEAMAIYNGAGLKDFQKDDRIPMEYKAYFYMRMGKFQMGPYADAFKEKYLEYYK